MIENFGYSSTIGLTIIKKKDVAKHLAGQHSQQSHAGGRGGPYEASASALASFQNGSWDKDDVDSLYMRKLAVAYKKRYSVKNEDGANSEFEVEDEENTISEFGVEGYATSDYHDVNRVARGIQESDASTAKKISVLDKTIEQSPDAFGDKTLYRVASDRLITELNPGDTFIDKGFLSTTRKNIVRNATARKQLGNISPSDDTVVAILPSPSRTGKGLAVDTFLETRGLDGVDDFWGKEKEVLLPRETPLLFLGLSTTRDTEGKTVAVFQRMDK